MPKAETFTISTVPYLKHSSFRRLVCNTVIPQTFVIFGGFLEARALPMSRLARRRARRLSSSNCLDRARLWRHDNRSPRRSCRPHHLSHYVTRFTTWSTCASSRRRNGATSAPRAALRHRAPSLRSESGVRGSEEPG